MIILDENISEEQRDLLRQWKLNARHIGYTIGQSGLKDDQIVSLLHSLRRPTFLTRDSDFYKPRLRHAGYCLAWFNIGPDEVATLARRFLRHPDFNTAAKRMGTVIRVSADGLTVWRLRSEQSFDVAWSGQR